MNFILIFKTMMFSLIKICPQNLMMTTIIMVMVMIVMIMIMVMMHRGGDDIYDYSDNDVQNVDFISDSDDDVDE